MGCFCIDFDMLDTYLSTPFHPESQTYLFIDFISNIKVMFIACFKIHAKKVTSLCKERLLVKNVQPYR